MELKDANSGANWHPLTSLITFESQEEHRVHYFIMGALDGSPDFFSTLLHEMTHFASARFGRLGLYLARIAAREYLTWQRTGSPGLTLTRSERRILGAYVPLLEGLAIYTQLDFEAEEDEGPHYSPLYLIANLAIADHAIGSPLPEKFRIWRSGAMAGEGASLLEGLLLDRSREDLNYYLYGYLYVKALQSHWVRRCLAFTRPAVFLPFALKLLVEHPVLLTAEQQGLTAAQVVSTLHQTLTSLSADDLSFITGLFTGRQTLSEFDHFDIYRQLQTRSSDQIYTHDEDYLRPFISGAEGDERDYWMGVFRASNSVYVYAWCEGLLKFTGDDAYNAVLEAPEGDSEVHLVPPAKAWYEAWDQTIKGEQDPQLQALRAKVGDSLLNMEVEFFKTFLAAEGKSVCLAGFMTMFRSIPGLALWVDGQYAASLISEPWHLLQIVLDKTLKDEMTILGSSLRIPPPDRVKFARAFTDREAVARQTRAAGKHLLPYLVSDPKARLRLRRRLAGIWGENLAEAHKWAKGLPGPYPIPAHLRDRADEVFDLPGFIAADTGERVSFEELLPHEFTSR